MTENPFAQLRHLSSAASVEVPSLDDFKIMHAAANYKAGSGKFLELLQTRPVALDGGAITDDQIITEYQNYERALKNPGSVTESQMEFMKSCYDWCKSAMRDKEYRQAPKMPDGSPMTLEQMNELVTKYQKFQKEDSLGFSRLIQELKKGKKK